MNYGSEHARNKEALDLMVRMRSGNGGGASTAAYTPANKMTSLFGLLIIASTVVPLGVCSGIIPKSTVANIPVLNELPTIGASASATSTATVSAKASNSKHSHKHGKKAAHVRESHQATGRILNAG